MGRGGAGEQGTSEGLVERNGMGDGLRGGVEADGAVGRVRHGAGPQGARKGFLNLNSKYAGLLQR
jgi:hypothetical protein